MRKNRETERSVSGRVSERTQSHGNAARAKVPGFPIGSHTAKKGDTFEILYLFPRFKSCLINKGGTALL